MKTPLSMINDAKAYCIQGSDQMSLFSETTMRDLVPPEKRRQRKKLFALVTSLSDGHSWWQEIERAKGERPWQACLRYKNESLGKGYWISDYELR